MITQIRSSEAPDTQTLRFDLPDGASLQASGEGAAEILEDGEAVAGVHPPSAIDAAGEEVPVSAQVAGDTITYTAEPGPNAIFPLLLDPVIEEYTWGNGNQTNMSDWEGSSSIPMLAKTKAECESWCAGYLANGSNGLWIADYTGWKNSGSAVAGFKTYVPRWLSDWTKYGNGPTSYISHATYYALSFQHRTDSGFSPQLIGGLAAPELGSFVTSFARNGGQANFSLDSAPYPMNGNNSAKEAQFVFLSSEARYLSANRDAWMGWATLELTDDNHPKGAAGATAPQWVNNSPTSVIPFEWTDTGLGVSSVTLSDKSGHSWKTSLGCTGAVSSPCPRVWSSTGSQPQLNYDPSVLPQGTDSLEMVATDPVGHANNVKLNEEQPAEPRTVQVKVDHTAPTLALSGTMTEQGTLGTTLPQYKLKYVAKDGSEASHQSGVASVEVKVDGAKITEASQAPGCATKDCELTKEWTLQASSYSMGSHIVEVIAKDAVGLATTQKLTIGLGADLTAPGVGLSGQIPSAPEGWVEQKSYSMVASATDVGGYGVKSLEYKVDGVVKATATAPSCPAGGCPFSKTWTVNAAEYGGGAHKIEVIGYDNAGLPGNMTTRTLTMNVDPQGTISTTEAKHTLEAAEETAPEEAPVVAPTNEVISEEEREEGNNPGLVQSGNVFTSTGTPAVSTISTNPEEGFSVEMLEGEELSMDPVATASGKAEVVSGAAVVAGGSSANVTTIARPKFNGVLAFQAIRDASAPEEYSWDLALEEGQYAEPIDEKDVGVYFEDGTLAALVAAEFAHDGVGHPVPTTLTLTEAGVLTLTIHHRGGGFVYPVLGGAALEVGYTPVIDPNPTQEPLMSFGKVSAPSPVPQSEIDAEDASVSSTKHPPRWGAFEWDLCAFTCWAEDLPIEGKWRFNGVAAWWKPKPHPACPISAHAVSMDLTYCDWAGKNFQPFDAVSHHISALAKANINGFLGASFTAPEHLTMYLYGDGYGKGHNTEALCNPLTSCE